MIQEIEATREALNEILHTLTPETTTLETKLQIMNLRATIALAGLVCGTWELEIESIKTTMVAGGVGLQEARDSATRLKEQMGLTS